MMKILKYITGLLATLAALPFVASADDTCMLTVLSPGRDSLYINDVYVAKSPCRIELKEGIYTFRVSDRGVSKSRRVLVSPGRSERTLSVKLPPVPKWSREATESQKAAISRIIEDLVYSDGTKKTDPFWVGRYTVSVEDWEAVTGEKFIHNIPQKLEAHKNRIPAYGLSYDQVCAFIARLNELSGIGFALPDNKQASCIAPDGGQEYHFSRGLLFEDTENKVYIYQNDYFGPDRRSGVYYCPELFEYTEGKELGFMGFLYGGMRSVSYDRLKHPYRTCFRLYISLERIDESEIVYCGGENIRSEEQITYDNYKPLFAEVLKEAEAGNPESMQTVGIMFHRGLGTVQNDQLSVQWLTKAAENGNSDALFQLAYCARYGVGMPQSYTVAFDIYKYLAEKGDALAIAKIGECYLNGWGVIESLKTAIDYFRASAEKGSGWGLYYLGRAYMEGLPQGGLQKDMDKAGDCLLKAVDQPDCPPEAYYELGNWLRKLSKEVSDDSLKSTAVDYYRIAYRKGCAQAHLMYADCLRNGLLDCKEDHDLAECVLYEYFKNPLGSFDRKGYVADCLGNYTLGDKESEVRWYQRAIYHGYVPAMVSLGKISEDRDAIYWYSLAAEEGDAQGQYNLAKCYNSGKGVEVDKETALYWMKAADDNGCMDPWFFDSYELLKKEMRINDSQNYALFMPDADLAWPGSEDYLIPDWKKVAEKYGRKTPQTAMAVFCGQKNSEYMFNSEFGRYIEWETVIKDNVEKDSELFGAMFRYVGSVYMSGVERVIKSVSDILEDRSSNIVVQGMSEAVAALYSREHRAEMKSWATRAMSAYEIACNAYLNSLGRRSPLYLKALIDYAISAYYCGETKVCAKSLETFAENFRPMLKNELSQTDAGQREKFLEEWQPYFTEIIPSFAVNLKDNEKLNGFTYDCALFYKGFRLGGWTPDYINLSWKDIQKNLKPGDIALEIMRVTYMESRQPCYIGAWFSKNDRAPHIVPLAPENALEAYKNRFYNTTDLYDYVWEKLSPGLKSAKRIYFSPDGLFYKIGIEYVPYDGLCYVDEKWEINRLSSTRELLSQDSGGHVASALLVGGLSYGEQVSSSRGSVDELPESGREVEEIGRMFGKAGIRYTLLSKEEGNEQNLRKMKSYPEIVHFATHGYNWNANQLRIRKGMRFISELEAAGTDMLGSGLLLSGANGVLQGDNTQGYESDGILSAAEVSEMDFSRTRLAVLSACESGLGRIRYDGIAGLQTGFKQAGVKTLLMSLWKVDDKATSLFMQEFYRSLFGGASAREAMVNARNFLRSYEEPGDGASFSLMHIYPYRDPEYWAAFILLDGLDTKL